MERKKVLIITSSVDETVTYIVNKYSESVDFFRVDVDRFGQYGFYIGNKGWCISKNQTNMTVDEVYSIYYRKPILPNLSSYERQYHPMIQRDIISVINGIADGFSGKVLTRPSILRRTENKVYQLLYVREKRWNIPHSYIGNVSSACRDYEKNESIIKPLTTGKIYGSNGWEIYQTNIFKGNDEDIGFTPLYLQEYMEKQFEVRVTIVGKYVYPIRIDTKNKIDWRADYRNHVYTQIICPSEVVKKCYEMMSDFDLQFGAFDFIVTPDDEWIFLEVNPNGQWLWLEQSLGLDISEKIIEYLIEE